MTNKKINDGKRLEELVAMIEKSLSPDCRIERNYQMPILNSPSGLTTECDIVVWVAKNQENLFQL